MHCTRAECAQRASSLQLESVRSTSRAAPLRFTVWQSVYRLQSITSDLLLDPSVRVIDFAAQDRTPRRLLASKPCALCTGAGLSHEMAKALAFC